MADAEKAYKAGLIKTMLRYEDLSVGKTALVSKMLSVCGSQFVSAPCEADCNDVFRVDSHGKTATRSRRRKVNPRTGNMDRGTSYAYLRQGEVEHIQQVISRHGVIAGSDFVIPGTLMWGES